MNIRIRISLLIAVLLLAASTAFAERGPRHDRMNQRPGGEFGTQVIEHLTRAIRQLDLSDEQRESIRSDLKGLKESLQPTIKELHQGRKELHGLVTADSYDADAVSAIAENQGDLVAEITTIASGAAAGVLAQLSDEQRAELMAMGEERRAHREGHREKMKAHKKERMEKREQETAVGN